MPFDPNLVVAYELYDYDNDPNETINVADEKSYTAISAELNKKMIGFLVAQQTKLQRN